MRLDGKETKAVVQQTTMEATAMMQIMAITVTEMISSLSLNCNPGSRTDAHTTGSQWRQELGKWFSSPDPSTNHVILCGAQHQGTANWFFQGSLFEEWKATGSLLWIHGKRMSFNIPRPIF